MVTSFCDPRPTTGSTTTACWSPLETRRAAPRLRHTPPTQRTSTHTTAHKNTRADTAPYRRHSWRRLPSPRVCFGGESSRLARRRRLALSASPRLVPLSTSRRRLCVGGWPRLPPGAGPSRLIPCGGAPPPPCAARKEVRAPPAPPGPLCCGRGQGGEWAREGRHRVDGVMQAGINSCIGWPTQPP